jgi:hypothetical protein
MNSKMTKKENLKRILSTEEMLLFRGGAEAQQKPKTPGEVIILPFRY